MAAGRRFQIAHQFTTIFADRLRLGTIDDPAGFNLVLHPGDPADEDASQAMVTVNLAKIDRAAYQRAAAAFNAVMDEHERARAPALAARRGEPRSSAGQRSQSLVTAAAQVAILAAFLPAVVGRCLGLL